VITSHDVELRYVFHTTASLDVSSLIYTFLVTLYLITYYLSSFTFVFFFSHVQPSQSNLIFFVTTQLV